MTRTPAMVAVVGPTASGKSAVALAAARQLGNAELVSVDSMQVYRGMDIGTAKPSPAERAEVPHHLIDLVDPDHDFTVAEFQRAFTDVIHDLAARDRQAILVGGTGLYHRAVIDQLELPAQWPQLRRALEADAERFGAPALHARLVTVDPEAAARIEPGNSRRIVRALEVFQGSGRRFSSFGPGLDDYPPSSITQVGLRWDRHVLAQRIERRVHQMIAAGLLDEVARLLDAGLSRTARQALGYKELIDHLEGRIGFDEAVALVVTRTRQFAVRQLRWFQRDPRLRWVDVEHDAVAEATPVVVAAIST